MCCMSNCSWSCRISYVDQLDAVAIDVCDNSVAVVITTDKHIQAPWFVEFGETADVIISTSNCCRCHGIAHIDQLHTVIKFCCHDSIGVSVTKRERLDSVRIV